MQVPRACIACQLALYGLRVTDLLGERIHISAYNAGLGQSARDGYHHVPGAVFGYGSLYVVTLPPSKPRLSRSGDRTVFPQWFVAVEGTWVDSGAFGLGIVPGVGRMLVGAVGGESSVGGDALRREIVSLESALGWGDFPCRLATFRLALGQESEEVVDLLGCETLQHIFVGRLHGVVVLVGFGFCDPFRRLCWLFRLCRLCWLN